MPKESEIEIRREGAGFLNSVVAFLESFNFFVFLLVLCCACHCAYVCLWFCTSVLCEGVCLSASGIQVFSLGATPAKVVPRIPVLRLPSFTRLGCS